MRKLIAAINMTLDGVFDHTLINADEEIHHHYSELIENTGIILYGRKTYQLMEFWRTILEKPVEEASMNEFAAAMDRVPKLVFSRTLKQVDWHSAKLARKDLRVEVLELRQQAGKDILVGSRSLILELLKLQLVDEFQLTIQTSLAGQGMRLFEGIIDPINFKLSHVKSFKNSEFFTLYLTCLPVSG